MTDVVGRTPVVQLRRVVPDDAARVFVKLEWFNPTGSCKDRMALAMIEEAERRGDLRPGMTVLECTAGSTGSSLGFVCEAKGYRLRIVTSDAFAAEKLATMRALGVELTVVPSAEGRITVDLTSRMIETARGLAAEEGLLAGASTGLNVVGAIELAQQLAPDRTVVTVACDTGLKYLSGGLFDPPS